MPWVAQDLNVKENCKLLLWQFHNHDVDMQSFTTSDDFVSADLVFLVYFEGIMDVYKHHLEDKRIHVWDSLVNSYYKNFYPYFWHWWQTNEVDKHMKLSAKITDPLKQKPQYVFDCFAGSRRLHRDMFFEKLEKEKFSNLIGYGSWISGLDKSESGGIEHGTGNISGTNVVYNIQSDALANISKFVPYKIYNQTWFSIVLETDFDRSFFTEKIAKALVAKKPFLLLSAPGSLRDLRRLGFKTFAHVWDESYDEELELERRIDLIIEQYNIINCSDPAKIYKECIPVIEHNQQLIQSLNWDHKLRADMQNILDSW
jgi:hypothetical protein